MQLGVASTAAESGTQLAILVCEVEDGLGEVCGLDNAANLDSTFILDQFTNQEQEFGGELGID